MILWGPGPNIRHISGVDSTTCASRLWHLPQGEWSQRFLEMCTSLSKPFMHTQMCDRSPHKGPGTQGTRTPPVLCHHLVVWLWTSHFPFLSLNSLLNKMKKSFVLRDLHSNSCSSFLNLCSLESLSACFLVSETTKYIQVNYLEAPPPLMRQMPSPSSTASRSGGLAQPASVYPSSGFPLGQGWANETQSWDF